MTCLIDTIQDKYGYEAAERAAIYEFDGGMTREMADSKVIYQEELKKRTATCGVSNDLPGKTME